MKLKITMTNNKVVMFDPGPCEQYPNPLLSLVERLENNAFIVLADQGIINSAHIVTVAYA